MKIGSRVKWLLAIILFLVVLLIFKNMAINDIHSCISDDEINSIYISGMSTHGNIKIEDDKEIKNIVKWFNAITDIRENKDFLGVTDNSEIIINLKTNKQILILKSGIDFEIQRYDKNGKWISYWGKQTDISRLLSQT